MDKKLYDKFLILWYMINDNKQASDEKIKWYESKL